MKAKLALVALLVAVLALTGVGCSKANGGGWFTNTASGNDWGYGHRITFGFNAQYDDEDGTVKGQFQLIDHDAKINLHGTFDSTETMGWFDFGGLCVVKGKADVNGEEIPFEVTYADNGEPGVDARDSIQVYVGEAYPWLYCYIGDPIGGGNIQYHE